MLFLNKNISLYSVATLVAGCYDFYPKFARAIKLRTDQAASLCSLSDRHSSANHEAGHQCLDSHPKYEGFGPYLSVIIKSLNGDTLNTVRVYKSELGYLNSLHGIGMYYGNGSVTTDSIISKIREKILNLDNCKTATKGDQIFGKEQKRQPFSLLWTSSESEFGPEEDYILLEHHTKEENRSEIISQRDSYNFDWEVTYPLANAKMVRETVPETEDQTHEQGLKRSLLAKDYMPATTTRLDNDSDNPYNFCIKTIEVKLIKTFWSTVAVETYRKKWILENAAQDGNLEYIKKIITDTRNRIKSFDEDNENHVLESNNLPEIGGENLDPNAAGHDAIEAEAKRQLYLDRLKRELYMRILDDLKLALIHASAEGQLEVMRYLLNVFKIDIFGDMMNQTYNTESSDRNTKPSNGSTLISKSKSKPKVTIVLTQEEYLNFFLNSLYDSLDYIAMYAFTRSNYRLQSMNVLRHELQNTFLPMFRSYNGTGRVKYLNKTKQAALSALTFLSEEGDIETVQELLRDTSIVEWNLEESMKNHSSVFWIIESVILNNNTDDCDKMVQLLLQRLLTLRSTTLDHNGPLLKYSDHLYSNWSTKAFSIAVQLNKVNVIYELLSFLKQTIANAILSEEEIRSIYDNKVSKDLFELWLGDWEYGEGDYGEWDSRIDIVGEALFMALKFAARNDDIILGQSLFKTFCGYGVSDESDADSESDYESSETQVDDKFLKVLLITLNWYGEKGYWEHGNEIMQYIIVECNTIFNGEQNLIGAQGHNDANANVTTVVNQLRGHWNLVQKIRS